jgi:peroxiredoxin (alkyl hydroperoxide reductase subunit C)
VIAQVGQPAPDVAAEAYVRGSVGPRQVRLADYRGTWVVLFFYPRDFTFVCPTEIREFARLADDFAAEEAVVLAASTDSYYCHKAWFEGDPRLAEVAYPVIADTTHALSAAFGVPLEDGTALRATFIIDPEGTVRHLQVNDLDVGRNVEETLRLLRALRTGELCPATWAPGEPTLTATLRAAAEVADPALPGAQAATSAVLRVTDTTIGAALAAERAVLILTRGDCPNCAVYQAEIEAAAARGDLAGIALAKLVLDEPGAARFKRDNPWLAGVDALPYTVLYRDGCPIDRFAASRGAYLLEQLRRSLADQRPEAA